MNKKLSLVLISTFLLCSCAERTYEAFGPLSSEQVETILCSYFEKYEISKKKYNEYNIYSHLVMLRENVSVDIISFDSDSSGGMACVTKNYHLNGTYICTVPYRTYNLNFCVLNEGVSYTLDEAYANKTINDDDIGILIQTANEKGLREE